MKYLAILALILAPMSPAFAAQMRDMSLSPAESMRQPDIDHSNGSVSGNYQKFLGNTGGTDPVQQRIQDQTGGIGASNRFMDTYCNPNFRPLAMQNNGSMQNCLTTQRQDVCQQFQHLPADAQQTLDQTINCYNADDRGTDCSSFDSRRLQLIKRYWNDQNTARSLVFLPDDIINGSNKCMGAR